MTQLVHYEAARRALDAAVRFDDVMKIKNVAEQAAVYAKQANDQDLIQKATEIKMRAQRKAGEMLAKSKESGHLADRSVGGQIGAASKHGKSPPTTSHVTLSDIGVTKDQSSQWQQLASMSDEHFETAINAAKETAGEVTTAFMLREAQRAKPHAPAKAGPKAEAMREGLRAAKERGVSMLETYARLTLTAVRSQDSFTEQERSLLAELSEAIAAVAA